MKRYPTRTGTASSNSDNIEIADAYVDWGLDLIRRGYEFQMLTFMFNPLGGSIRNMLAEMAKEIESVYASHATRVVRDPRAMRNAGLLPIWFSAPDFPVPKTSKTQLQDLVINDGLHAHVGGFYLPKSRMKESLFDYFQRQQKVYCGPERALARIEVTPITDTPEKALRYIFKALYRGWVDVDDIVVLPKARSQLPVSTKKERAAQRVEFGEEHAPR